MRMMCCLVGLVLVIWTAPLLAEVASGPAAGEKVPPLKVFAVTGEQENKEIDYAAERKDKPTIYVFVQADAFDRPMARFLKTLDNEIKNDSEQAYVVAVWLTDDKEKSKEYLPRAQQSVQLQNTALCVFPGEKKGPEGWNVNADARLTAVVVNKQKVAASFGYMSLNETDVAKVREALKKAVK
jgi:hypothetical protein